jgi:hypothetical protein
MGTYLSNRLRLALTTTVLACSSGNLALPNDGLPTDLQAFSGDGQEGTVGTQLPDPLVARVLDGTSRPVVGVSIVFGFQTEVSGAKIEPATAMTDDMGKASVRVRLGNTTGPQSVVARLEEDLAADLRATFGLKALDREQGNNDGSGDGGDAGEDDDDDDGHRHGDGHGGGHGHGDDDDD